MTSYLLVAAIIFVVAQLWRLIVVAQVVTVFKRSQREQRVRAKALLDDLDESFGDLKRSLDRKHDRPERRG